MHYWIAFICSLFGSFFILIASIGILKMPDIFIRMHTATKAGTLGCGLVLIGSSFYFQLTQVTVEALLTLLFIYITAPIASHLIGRAAYACGVPLSKNTKIDDLKKYYEQQNLIKKKE